MSRQLILLDFEVDIYYAEKAATFVGSSPFLNGTMDNIEQSDTLV